MLLFFELWGLLVRLLPFLLLLWQLLLLWSLLHGGKLGCLGQLRLLLFVFARFLRLCCCWWRGRSADNPLPVVEEDSIIVDCRRVLWAGERRLRVADVVTFQRRAWRAVVLAEVLLRVVDFLYLRRVLFLLLFLFDFVREKLWRFEGSEKLKQRGLGWWRKLGRRLGRRSLWTGVFVDVVHKHWFTLAALLPSFLPLLLAPLLVVNWDVVVGGCVVATVLVLRLLVLLLGGEKLLACALRGRFEWLLAESELELLLLRGSLLLRLLVALLAGVE